MLKCVHDAFFSRRLGVVVGAIIAFQTSLSFGQTSEFRAIWIDAFGSGFKSSSEVTQLIADARAGNFNAIIPQVRKRGDAYYNGSPYEPKATGLSPASFDPLQDMITKAHDTSGGQPRIEVHAWIVTYPISQTSAPPPGHPMALHPDWLTRDNLGNTFDGDNYVFDPGHPDVQRHTFNVAMDIISRYDVDGFNFDYIRYSGKAWGYNTNAVQRFNRIYNRTGQPSTTDSLWLQFRRDQVTALVRKIYLSAAAKKPGVKISADTICFAPGVTTDTGWSNSAAAWTDKLQDWRGWMQEGILDLNIPMMYFDQDTWASAWNNWSIFAKDHRYNRHVALGPALYLNSIDDSIVQIRSSRNNTSAGNHADGVSGYAYKQTNDEGVSRATFLSALTGPSVYDPITPAVFSTAVQTPVMSWKTAPTKGHLKGFVYAADGVTGLDYATVTLTGPANKTLRTDATGFYGAVDLPPGNYSLVVSFAGYQGATTNAEVTAGAVTSRDFNLELSASPFITQQPLNQSVLQGGTAVFSVTATGNPTPGYQWRFNSVNIPGANSSTYTRTNVSAADAGNYSVLVTNAIGSMPSSNALLSIVTFDSPPVLTRYPQSATVPAGSNATFTCVAEGTAPLSYQWQFNGSDIAGATLPSYTRTNVQPGDAGNYTIRVSNNAGNDLSAPAALAVHYQLATAISGSGNVTRNPDWPTYPPNTVVTLTAANYQVFSGWSGSVSSTANPINVTMNGHKSITATFTNEIVVDDTAATLSGSWSLGTSAGYWNTGYRFKSVTSGGTSYVQFTPNLPAAGNYSVYTWYVASSPGGNRPTNAQHVITYNGGTQTVSVNQEQNGSSWVLLGTFNFAAGTAGNVRITDGGGDLSQQVMADAVKFVAQASPPALPPIVLTQPESKSVIAGGSAVFSVKATGPGTLTYQWRYNGGIISSATLSTYTRSGATAGHAGAYSVAINNGNGSTVSSNATLLVNVPVAISSQPQSQTNNLGSDATFSVTATGTTNLGYKWRFLGAEIPGASSSVLTRTNIQGEDAGEYYAVVTNIVGGLSTSNALLAVRFPPVIVSHPLHQNVNAGAPFQFSVAAEGTAPLFYQWHKDGSPLVDATGNSYGKPAATAGDAGVYTVEVSNAAGTEMSDPADLILNTPPLITGQPQSRTNAPGTDATFTVLATGTEPLSYQWRLNGEDLPGETQNIFTVFNVQPSNSGDYTVVVTNIAGSRTSEVANLLVQASLEIIAGPQSRTNEAGTDAAFSVTCSGTPPLAYQWHFKAEPIASGTESTYVRPGVMNIDQGDYLVVVTNASGAVTSAPASLTVTYPAPPSFTNVSVVSPNAIELEMVGGPGQFEIEASSDLGLWTNKTTIITTNNNFIYQDENTAGTRLFYRIKREP